MAYRIKGDLSVANDMRLGGAVKPGNLTTAERVTKATLMLVSDKGARIFDTDTSSEFVWDGTSWVEQTSGGLVSRGTLTADGDLGDGLYSLDPSGGDFDFTLPVSSGGHGRREFVTSVATGTVTVKVQVGESMNGILDGTFSYTAVEGERVSVIDRSVGDWQVLVAGATGTISRNEIAIADTDLSLVSGATTLIFSTAPAAGQAASYGGRYYDEGSTRHVFVDMRSDEDDLCTFSLPTSVIPVGAEIEFVGMTPTDSPSASTEAWRWGISDADNQHFFVNRDDSAGDSLNFSLYLRVKGAAAGQVVLAGMVQPIELHRARVRDATGGATVSGSNDLTPSTTDYDVGSLVAGGIATIVNAGLYYLHASAGNVTASNNTKVYISVNGVQIASAQQEQTVAGPTLDILDTSATVDLGVGDTVQMGMYTAAIDVTSTTLTEQPTLEIIQLSSFSVILPEDVVVDDQATSGYFDVGTMRMQWANGACHSSGATDITLPAAFADATYTITTGVKMEEGSTGSLQAISGWSLRTTTTFTLSHFIPAGGASNNEDYAYIAIGLKP